MATTVRLRYLADVNPSTPAFDKIPDDEPVTFMPLETVWADSRVDTSRSRPKSEVSTGYVRFVNGDILSPKVTPTFQAGRSALITTMTTPAGAASTEVHVVRARPGLADPRFVRYGLLTKPFLEEGVSRFQGVAGLQRVPDEFLRDLALCTVDLSGQRRIADFLDDQVARIDNIIAARRTQMTLIDAAVDSEIDATFGTAALSSVTRLGRFLVRIEQGWSPQCDAIPADDDEWGVLKVSAVKRGHFNPDENKRLPDALQVAPAYEVRESDLLVTRANTPSLVGMFAVVPPGTRRRLIMSDKIMRLSLDDSLDPRFVAYSGRTFPARAQLTGAGTGTSQSMVNIRGDDIRDLRIRALALADQKALVSAAQASEAHFRAAKTQLAVQASRFEELKRSLITAAVMGEFDVSTADGSQVLG